MDGNFADITSNLDTDDQALSQVTPPTERKRPGRKPGQKNGTGNSPSLLRKREKAGKPAPEPTEAEKLEAIAAPKPPAAPAGDNSPARRKSAKGVAMGPEKFARSLQGLHKGAAFVFSEPDLELGDGEAKMVADALFDIFGEYDIVINTKLAAAVNLAGAGLLVYGPRMAKMRAKGAAARAQKGKKVPKAADAPFVEDQPQAVPPMAPEPIIDLTMFGNSGGG
jgi:hypothetical protein